MHPWTRPFPTDPDVSSALPEADPASKQEMILMRFVPPLFWLIMNPVFPAFTLTQRSSTMEFADPPDAFSMKNPFPAASMDATFVNVIGWVPVVLWQKLGLPLTLGSPYPQCSITMVSYGREHPPDPLFSKIALDPAPLMRMLVNLRDDPLAMRTPMPFQAFGALPVSRMIPPLTSTVRMLVATVTTDNPPTEPPQFSMVKFDMVNDVVVAAAFGPVMLMTYDPAPRTQL